jgi:hypothetical protein
MCAGSQPQDLAPIVLQNEQAIQQPKRKRRDDEQIHRCNSVCMSASPPLENVVAKERDALQRSSISAAIFSVALRISTTLDGWIV